MGNKCYCFSFIVHDWSFFLVFNFHSIVILLTCFKMKGYFSADNLHFNFMFESNKILDRWHIHGFLLHEVGFFVDWPCRERERWTDWWTDRQTDRKRILHQESDNKVSVDTIDRNRHLYLTKRFLKGQHSFSVVCHTHIVIVYIILHIFIQSHIKRLFQGFKWT